MPEDRLELLSSERGEAAIHPAIKHERWADQILPNAALERSTIACKRALPDGIEVDRHWVQVRPAAGLDDLARNVVPDQCRQPSISRVRPTPVS